MQRSRAAVALFIAFSVVTPAVTSAQGIGGLIKKKAAEAIKGPEKPAAKPEQSGGTDKCQITDDAMDRFVKGLETERAEKAALKTELDKFKSVNDYQACASASAQTPEAQKIAERVANLPDNASAADRQKAFETMGADLQKLITSRCGPDPTAWPNSKRAQKMREAEHAGAVAAGVDDDCYNLLKERAVPFCSLSKDQQQRAATEGIKVPGKQKDKYYVYTPAEAKALLSHCDAIMPKMSAIDNIEKGIIRK